MKEIIEERLGFTFDNVFVRAPVNINEEARELILTSPNNGLCVKKLGILVVELDPVFQRLLIPKNLFFM